MTAPQILVVDDEADIRTLIDEILSDEGYRVETAADAAEARQRMNAGRPDLVLLDIWMPDVDGITLLNEWSQEGRPACPVVMMSGHGTVETAVEATRLGAADFVEKPLSLQKLLRTVERALENRGRPPKRPPSGLLPEREELIGKSRPMQELRARARELAALPGPVLVVGEPGSGREATARYLHGVSAGREAPFVKQVAAALPVGSVATALLGDAAAAGLLARAAGGSLFISGAENLPDDARRLLAGILEQQAWSRPGEATQQALACRLILSVDATAGDDALGDALRRQFQLREIRVPPLREYPEDVSEMLRRTVDDLVEREQLPFRRFGLPAQNRLRNYPWPGNVQELRRLVRRLLQAGGPEEIGLQELESLLQESPTAAGEALVQQDLLAMPLREAREAFERAYLTEQLKLSNGKVGQLAKRVGMERTHLYRKLRSLGVDFRHVGDED
ncbi:MAG: sigma-54-dependent Fis family transcriptional regulator [Gammaproteobacteria bacterium]|nr:MAG: sigma-54-dependent Fis family transcriptional regulator [Gammaproteobacteria bacterium]